MKWKTWPEFLADQPEVARILRLSHGMEFLDAMEALIRAGKPLTSKQWKATVKCARIKGARVVFEGEPYQADPPPSAPPTIESSPWDTGDSVEDTVVTCRKIKGETDRTGVPVIVVEITEGGRFGRLKVRDPEVLKALGSTRWEGQRWPTQGEEERLAKEVRLSIDGTVVWVKGSFAIFAVEAWSEVRAPKLKTAASRTRKRKVDEARPLKPKVVEAGSDAVEVRIPVGDSWLSDLGGR
jgi:hypothetical protein